MRVSREISLGSSLHRASTDALIIACSSQSISNDPLCGRSYQLLAAIFAGDAQGKRKEIIVETTIADLPTHHDRIA